LYPAQALPAAAIDVAEIDRMWWTWRRSTSLREDEPHGMRAPATGGNSSRTRGRPTTTSSSSDAFGARDVPKHLTTLEFLQITRRALKPNGVVVSNIWRPASNRLRRDGAHLPGGVRELFIWMSRRRQHIFLALPRGSLSAKASSALLARKYRPRAVPLRPGTLVDTGSCMRARRPAGAALRDAD